MRNKIKEPLCSNPNTAKTNKNQKIEEQQKP
jgi:hypothetical protein